MGLRCAQEHETALRFFQRALQLDPAFPYAYTLCGHEYFANEDFDRSKACYENAIRLDRRHYNAWCGPALQQHLEPSELLAVSYSRLSFIWANIGLIWRVMFCYILSEG